MKIIKQVGIIFLICWLGLVIEAALPFSFPASIIGMILLFVCLLFGILKIEHIQEKSDFLLSNMAFFFVPGCVSLIKYWDVMAANLLPILVIILVTTPLVFFLTGHAVQLTLRLMTRKEETKQ